MNDPLSTATRLAAMNDAQITKFFEFWATGLVDGAETDLDTITSGIPQEVRSTPGFDEVTNLNAEGKLDPAASAATARVVLEPLADDPDMEPTIRAALDRFDDSLMMVDVILAVGLVASVLLIVSTTEFDGKIGPVKFHKGKADPETIKAIVEGVTSWMNPLGG